MHQNLVMKILILWLEKIGCKPYKTPPFHPQSNGLAERNGADHKNETESMFSAKIKNRSFSTKGTFKLSQNTTRLKDVFFFFILRSEPWSSSNEQT